MKAKRGVCPVQGKCNGRGCERGRGKLPITPAENLQDSRGLLGVVDSSALGAVMRITLVRDANCLCNVIRTTGEIVGINTVVCIKQWRLHWPWRLILLNTDLNAFQFWLHSKERTEEMKRLWALGTCAEPRNQLQMSSTCPREDDFLLPSPSSLQKWKGSTGEKWELQTGALAKSFCNVRRVEIIGLTPLPPCAVLGC